MRPSAAPLAGAAPYLFVVVWSSGYIVAKYILPYAEPLTFLCIRYAAVVVLMAVIAFAARAPWPLTAHEGFHIALAGILMQAGYLGGVWCAIRLGMPAGVAALIVNTQPILTAILARALGEPILGRQWLGLALGILGVALVVSNKITGEGLAPLPVSLAVAALLSMTAGVLYQKHYCPRFDARTGQIIQFAASFIVTLPLALVFEDNTVDVTPQFLAALAWSVLVLSGLGISLLFIMIRHGTATRVTSFMYLVPPVTALMAWLCFGETFSLLAVIGMLITVTGVALVVRQTRVPTATLPSVAIGE